MLFIVRQYKDLPLLLLFQFLPSYCPTPLFPEASDLRSVQMKTTERQSEPRKQTEYLTHLHSLISYLIVNFKPTKLISLLWFLLWTSYCHGYHVLGTPRTSQFFTIFHHLLQTTGILMDQNPQIQKCYSAALSSRIWYIQ